jgi:hypothetical protein
MRWGVDERVMQGDDGPSDTDVLSQHSPIGDAASQHLRGGVVDRASIDHGPRVFAGDSTQLGVERSLFLPIAMRSWLISRLKRFSGGLFVTHRLVFEGSKAEE